MTTFRKEAWPKLPMLVFLSLGQAPFLISARAATPSAVVRSKEWVVRRGKQKEEEFIGDVRYQSAGTQLTADWALYRHGPKDWNAKGKVKVRKELSNGDLIEARGEQARYDETARAGRLEPAPGKRVSFARTPAEGGPPDEGEGDRLSWEGEDAALLSGRARGWGPRAEFWSDEARWTARDRSLRLSGHRPVLHKLEGEWTIALKADRIQATDSPRRIAADGSVRGWIYFKDREKLKRLAR